MTNKPVILIVDDIPDNVGLLATLLQDDYQIMAATTGKRCLELLEKKPVPDLILLDIVMPDMDGYETFKKIKTIDHATEVPVIFITGRDREEDEEFGLQLGAVDYITRPLRPSVVLARVNTHITIKQQRDQLLAMATHDQLTGLHNRHYFLECAQKKISRATRHQSPLSLLMLDIDHFKSINDQYGHQTGDLVLQHVASLLRGHCREEDEVIRFGGEEFLILLDNSNLESARYKADRLREAIEKSRIMQISVTCSIGIAHLNAQKESIENLIRRADQALYKAKDSGRNRIVVDIDDTYLCPSPA